MRLFRVFLAAALSLGATASPIWAESAEDEPGSTAKKPRAVIPPYRLVRILPETNQALLFDRNRGTHVLVDAGNTVGGYDVVEIDDDHVVLARPGEGQEFVLVAGEVDAPTSRVVDPYPMIPAPSTPAQASMLLDPYPSDVLDPYGSQGVREVQAPEDQRADEDVPPPPKAAPPPPKADPPPPPKADPPAKEAEPREQSLTVARSQLDDALSDFVAIEKDVDMALIADGVELIKVAKGSFFHRMGLRDGDVVNTVDGTAIHGLDDAASVYARLGKAKRFVVEVTRAGAPLTLRYQITAK